MEGVAQLPTGRTAYCSVETCFKRVVAQEIPLSSVFQIEQ